MIGLFFSAMLLAIESSCDETAVAIIRRSKNAPELLSSLISSQIQIHREFGGVVPEVACRNHAQRIAPLVEEALKQAGVSLEEIESFAATRGPGLASSLLIGLSYAKGLAVATGKPFYGVNHMEGHLLSPFLGSEDAIPRHLGLVVSGGHTLLIEVEGFRKYRKLGGTIDDAAGEAFDKVGRMLKLPYPGGPEIEKAAREGDATAFQFPRAMIHKDHFDFSFSGLKTAVLYALQKLENPEEHLPDLAASFQKAVIDSLVKKTIRAAKENRHDLVTLSGGVACNKALQNVFVEACENENIRLQLTPPALTTDNAAMIAFAGLLMSEELDADGLTIGIEPNLPLAR